MPFSDYIIFADESGDHGMQHIDPEFPLFSLVFCIFEKAVYQDEVEPALRALKFKWFGHDAVVLHEREIRKQMPPFDFLRGSAAVREEFFNDLTSFMEGVRMQVYASVIDKERHRARYANPWNPYEVAMHFCLEKLCACLVASGQEGKLTHVLFEGRGKVEDQDLELEFRRISAGQSQWGWRRAPFEKLTFEPVFVAKAANLAGHQISDLIARPLALRALRPDQPNRALDTIRTKINDFKVFP
jgi:hypothetical protein